MTTLPDYRNAISYGSSVGYPISLWSFKNGKEIKVSYDDYGQETCLREILYCAPNWSWASVDSPVIYPYDDENICLPTSIL